MRALIKDLEAYNRAKGLTDYTIAWYSRKLRDFAQWLDGDNPLSVSPRMIRSYISEKVKRGLKPATIKGYYCTLSVFYSFLVIDEIIDQAANPMRKLKPPKVPQRAIEPLTESQIETLLKVFNQKRLTGRRNYAICVLILDTGLRIAEVATLKLGDINFKRRRLKVVGKGNKQRWVYMGKRTAEILRHYMADCLPGLPNGNNILFPSYFTGRAFRPSNLSKVIMRLMDKAGIPRAHSSAHRLRHTFAVNFLRGGGGVFQLQRLLGHSTLTMTKRYVMLADEDLAEAHRQASPVDRMNL